MVHREELTVKVRSEQRRWVAAPPPPDVCTALPHRGRGAGANPVSARSHSIQTTERYLGCKQRIQGAVNAKI